MHLQSDMTLALTVVGEELSGHSSTMVPPVQKDFAGHWYHVLVLVALPSMLSKKAAEYQPGLQRHEDRFNAPVVVVLALAGQGKQEELSAAALYVP